MDILARLPAVVVLERVRVPTLAIAREGTILCANTAFAEMVGYWQDKLAGETHARDQRLHDQTVLPEWVTKSVARSCRLGGTIELSEIPDAGQQEAASQRLLSS